MYNKVMEDRKHLCKYDENNMRYVGWENSRSTDNDMKILFSENVFRKISQTITKLLAGVHPEKKSIIVSNRVIGHMLSSQYHNDDFGQVNGNMYTKYIIPDNVNNYNHLARVINKSINTITDYIKNEYEMIENNKKLTIWTTVLGDFNNHGLRAHAPIRVKEKKTQSMAFNMNY